MFRGKRKATGTWIEGYYSVVKTLACEMMTLACEMIQPSGESVAYSVEPSTVGQYTGLTDKNGVKIFEGDIVKCSDGNNYQVVFEQRNNTAYFGLAITSDDTWVFDDGANYILEVIGNVHDNPELLKGN